MEQVGMKPHKELWLSQRERMNESRMRGEEIEEMNLKKLRNQDYTVPSAYSLPSVHSEAEFLTIKCLCASSRLKLFSIISSTLLEVILVLLS